ncbi:hypothetical protein LCGC14_0220310 [marine sediment metagenome]|uniref:Uncharacterized protein n=1 Tax=marine sediment metagenome TaxID=412755 RepID=A0A0F9UDA2_9ZZZZ
MDTTELKVIAAAQKEFLEAGYQWQENIYNDGLDDNCFVNMTKSTDPCAFGVGYPEPEDTVGWGRFPRVVALHFSGNLPAIMDAIDTVLPVKKGGTK